MRLGASSESGPAVLHLVYNLIRGGTEGQCARVAMEMHRRGYPHRVAVFRREGFFLEAVERACGPVFGVGIRRMARLETWKELRRLARYLRTHQFHLAHCWDADAAIFGSLAARMARVPFVTSRRDLGEIYPGYKLWLMSRADRRAAAVVVNADAIREKLLARGLPAQRVVKIPNLLDLNEFDELSRQPFSGRERLPHGRLVGYVTRLDPEKDVGTAIRAVFRLGLEFPDVYLVVAGSGPEREALERLAGELAAASGKPGLRNRVVFLGEVTDVPAFLRHIEIGVLTPSRNEGLSNAILEYMAASKPVVATDCGGNREVVQEGVTGRLVPPRNFEAVAASLRELLRNPDLGARCGAEGRRTVERCFTSPRILPLFEDLYERICAPRAGSAESKPGHRADK